MRKYTLLNKLVKDAFNENSTIEQIETALASALRKIRPSTEQYKALISYAAWRLSGDYIRSHRLQPLETEIQVHVPDERFRPERRTPQEQQEHIVNMAVRVFEFRMSDNSSIWDATMEKLNIEIGKRKKHIIGCQQRCDFLETVRDKLQPGQTPRSVGLTHEDMWSMYKEALTTT